MKGFVSLFKNKNLRYFLTLCLFIASVLIILSMLLGNQAGQFVIRVQNGDVKKSISITDKDYANLASDTTIFPEALQPSLIADGMDEMNDYSPEYFMEEDYATLKELTEEPGMHNWDHNSLYIYTFYIVNTSQSGGVGVNVSLNYSKVTKHLDSIIRVMTYYESYAVSDPQIYQLVDDEVYQYDNYIIAPKYFKNSSVVFDDQTINIGYGKNQDYVKYSILIWLEGNDPDSEKYGTELYGGTIKFSMDIKVAM